MFDATRSLRRGFAAVAWWLTSSSGLAAQTVALGAGALITNDFTDPVLELYVAGPRVRVVQPYAIGSWQLSDR
ncbi:hypothetical protein, partial [Hydrogenophaga sp.]|uniref:hypothetical protein n=1 Tax=Hydrogenophaga sp. TaxID=1904254 RepID=UPI0025C102F5